MRVTVVLLCSLLVFAAQGATPELGKNKLRRLVKLPAISFQPEWSFDPESGFTLGSAEQERTSEIKALRAELRDDPDDADAYLRLSTLLAKANDGGADYARSRAVRLFRNRVEAQPDDSLLLASL